MTLTVSRVFLLASLAQATDLRSHTLALDRELRTLSLALVSAEPAGEADLEPKSLA